MSSFKVTAGRDGSRRTFDEHDDRNDRGAGGDGRRHGGGGGGRNRQDNRRGGGGRGFYKRGRGINPRSRLGGVDDDIDMQDYSGSAKHRDRFNPYRKHQPGYGRNNTYLTMDEESASRGGRGGMRGGRAGRAGRGNNRWNRPGGQPNTFDSQSGWYRVVVRYANKMDKKSLLDMINNAMNVPFVPIGFYMEGTNGIFFVNDQDAAKAIRLLNRQLSMPNGYKISLTIRPDSNPQIGIDDNAKEKIKVVMSNRYDPSTKTLNLSNLYNDDSLKNDGIRLLVTRSAVMEVILGIIHENIPELLSLNLSDNRLRGLDVLSDIAVRAPNLTKLDLSKNVLKSIRELSKIRNLKLEALQLEGNELCDSFKDETSYVSAVRKPFPKLIHLDGHDLPPPVTFDVEETTTLPISKGSVFMDEHVQKRVCIFIEQYIKIYDSNDRQSLFEAYHDKAVFSISACYNKLLSQKQNIGEYLGTSRNMLRVDDNTRRHKLLKMNRLNILSTLNDLPQTEHDLASFIVDVALTTPDMMVFTLRGLFRETGSKMEPPPIRYFSRTFVTVPHGQGIVIINEQYTLMPASMSQVKEAFRTPAPTPSSSPVIPVATSSDIVVKPETEVQAQMITQFSMHSGMNQAFSQRCLEENGWNYDSAARVFVDLQAKGSIPPEAFQR